MATRCPAGASGCVAPYGVTSCRCTGSVAVSAKAASPKMAAGLLPSVRAAREMTSLPYIRMAMAGAGGGRRSAGATPRVTRRSSKRLVVSVPRGGPPWAPLSSSSLGSPDFDRPRRSSRLQSQKENDPCPPCAPPSPPPSPTPTPVAPRVRRSYSRLEVGETPRGQRAPPLSPLNLPPTAPPEPLQIPPLDLPGIGAGPERKRKKKVTPIDLSELEAWAASMNAQFEEAERFHLVVE